MVAVMGIEDVLKQFSEDMSIPDPVLDQAFSEMREMLKRVGISSMTPQEARVALTIVSVYAGLEPTIQTVLTGYLGTLIGPPNE